MRHIVAVPKSEIERREAAWRQDKARRGRMAQRGPHLSRKEQHDKQVAYWSTQQCGFCKDFAGSKEHVWPQWLLDRARRTKETRFLLSDGNDVEMREWRGRGAEIVTYAICDPCNELFGRKIEQGVSSILPTMAIDGKSTKIDSVTGSRIMTWMLLKAMTFDLFEEASVRVYTQSDRESFRQFVDGAFGALIPPVLNCFVGICVPMDEIHTYLCPGFGFRIGETANSDRPDVRFNTFTVAFATLVLQVITANIPPKKDRAPAGGALTRLGNFVCSNKFTGTVSEIFPGPTGSSVTWPCGTVLGDATMGLEEFSKRWGTEIG
jgi:hypothetical protein